MDEFLKYLPLANFVITLAIIPLVGWVIKVESRLTYIATILDTCEYCPGGTKHKKK